MVVAARRRLRHVVRRWRWPDEAEATYHPYLHMAGELTEAEIAAALSGATGVPVHQWLIYEDERTPSDDTTGRRLVRLERRPGGTFATEIDVLYHPHDDPYLDFARRVAAASGRACLADDGTVAPDRYVLVEPDGAVRVVALDSELADGSGAMSLARGSHK